MPREYSRTQRIADVIQHELAQLIQREVKDPRLGLVTVSSVVVSKDLSYAKVYVTVLGGESKIKEVIKTLNNAGSYLRTLLAKSVQLRITPQLKFYYDESINRGSKMSALIDEAIAADEKQQRKKAKVEGK